jgi:hypothetical protein
MSYNGASPPLLKSSIAFMGSRRGRRLSRRGNKGDGLGVVFFLGIPFRSLLLWVKNYAVSSSQHVEVLAKVFQLSGNELKFSLWL